ncbi:MAG: hypothetical protein WD766_09345 [Gemmatimonadota bacterium]
MAGLAPDRPILPSRPLVSAGCRPPAEAVDLLGEVGELRGPDGWQAQISVADALISLLTVRIDSALLEAAPRLRIVANAVVGFDNVHEVLSDRPPLTPVAG